MRSPSQGQRPWEQPGHCLRPNGPTVRLTCGSVLIHLIIPKGRRTTGPLGRAIACFKVGWDQHASSAGPPSENIEKSWWAGAAKRRWSHPTSCADPTRRWPCPLGLPTCGAARTRAAGPGWRNAWPLGPETQRPPVNDCTRTGNALHVCRRTRRAGLAHAVNSLLKNVAWTPRPSENQLGTDGRGVHPTVLQLAVKRRSEPITVGPPLARWIVSAPYIPQRRFDPTNHDGR